MYTHIHSFALHTYIYIYVCSQFVGEDIEVIETTIPRLEAFHITYAAIVSDVDVLLHKIDQYSVSAISNDVVRAKNDGLQVNYNNGPREIELLSLLLLLLLLYYYYFFSCFVVRLKERG